MIADGGRQQRGVSLEPGPDFSAVKAAALEPLQQVTHDVTSVDVADAGAVTPTPVRRKRRRMVSVAPVRQRSRPAVVPFRRTSPVPEAAVVEAVSGPGVPFQFTMDLNLPEPMTRADVAHALMHAQHPQQRNIHFSVKPVPGHWCVLPDWTYNPKATSGEKTLSFAIASPQLQWGHQSAGAVFKTLSLIRDHIGAEADPTGRLAVSFSASAIGVAELASVCSTWYRLEPAIDSLVCLDARWSSWALPSLRSTLGSVGSIHSAGTSLQRLASLISARSPIDFSSVLSTAQDRRESFDVALHHSVLSPHAVLCWAGLMQRLLAVGASHAGIRVPTPAEGAEWDALVGELLAESPAMAEYFETRREEVKLLHTGYARNYLQHTDTADLIDSGRKEIANVDPRSELQVLAGVGGVSRVRTCGGDLAVHVGSDSVIRPRDAAHRRAFPIPVVAPVRSVDSDVQVARGGIADGALLRGKRFHTERVSVDPEVAASMHFVPEPDTLDPGVMEPGSDY